MTPIRRIVAIVLAIGAVIGVLGGCDVTFTGGSSSDQDCQDRTLDLRQPPTRDAVDMPSDTSMSSWTCDEGFDLTVVLSGQDRLELTSRRVTFSASGSNDRAADPTTIDINSVWLSIDEAGDLADVIADTLGMDHTQIDQWRREAQDPPDDTLDTKTGFIPGSAGDMKSTMQIIHQSVDGKNNVHLSFYANR